ncbi:MAG: thioredoxin [Chloroflexota bacterium]
MPVYDTPITTDDRNLDKVLGQKLPVVLVLYDRPNRPLEEALSREAREHAGELLFARVNVAENPATYQRFDRPALPALLTFDGGEIESRAANIQPEDLEAHVDFMLGQGPKPVETAAEAAARAGSGAAPVHVTDTTFHREVLSSDLPVLVDFWAPWCGPCHMVAPVLDRVAQKYAGRIKVAKLNVDENPATASRYRAMSIPMLLMFRNGEPVGKLVGAHPQPNIEQLVQQALR